MAGAPANYLDGVAYVRIHSIEENRILGMSSPELSLRPI